MTIEEWFNNGCNYSQGIAIYAALKNSKPNLARLFFKKQTIGNEKKLQYELQKYLPKKTKTTTKAIQQQNKKIAIKQAFKKNQSFYNLNQLHVDLHPLAMAQRNNFQKAISYHQQLVNVQQDNEAEALRLSILIEDTFDAIEATQKVLTHYVNTKQIISINKRDYKAYSAAQLIDTRRNKRTSVSKFKKKVSILTQQLKQPLRNTEKTKITVALDKAKQKLIQHEADLQQLNELINQK